MGRPARVLSRLLWPAGRRGAFATGLRAPVVWTTCVALAELAWRSWLGTPLPVGAVLRVLALSTLVGTLLGLCAGLVGLFGRREREREHAPGLFAWLWDGDAVLHARRVGGIAAALGLALLAAPLALVLTRDAVIRIAQPLFSAATIVALHFGLFALAVAAFPGVRRAATAAARTLSPLPVAGAPLRLAGRFVALLTVLGAAVTLGLLVRFWATLSYLPWEPIGSVTLGSLAAVGWLAGERHLPWAFGVVERALLRPVLAVAVVLGLSSLEAARDQLREAREVLLARLGHDALLLALDFDRDGHLSVLGGGDCAPFDPEVNPVAIDVPNNGRDEDCDGADLDVEHLARDARMDYPLPRRVAPKRPPIVLVTIDAFAASRMKALGGTRGVTPRLDAIAQKASFFPHGFSQGPSTRLSFPSMFTSRWDSQIRRKLVGKHPFPIEPSELTLAEVLAGEGYHTVAVLPDPYFSRQHWGSLTAGFSRVNDSALRVRGHNSARVTDLALEELHKRPKQRIFLWVHYYDAHSPHERPPEIPSYGNRIGDRYDAELALVDRELGRLIEGIDRELGDKALTIITGDHGIAFDEPRHAKFNYGYDLSTAVLNVPLIVRAGWVRRQTIDEIVSTMDIAPTIANLLQVKRKLPFEGVSLVPELLSGERRRPQRLLHEFYITERRFVGSDPLEIISLRTDRYNLVHDRRVGSFELYDWRADYYETHDLSAVAEHAPALAALKQQLSAYNYRLSHERAAAATAASAAARGTR